MSQLPPAGYCQEEDSAGTTQSFQTSNKKYSNHFFLKHFFPLNAVADSPFSQCNNIEAKTCIKSEKINVHGPDFHADSNQLFAIDCHVNTVFRLEYGGMAYETTTSEMY